MNLGTSLTSAQILQGVGYVAMVPELIACGVLSVRSIVRMVSNKEQYSTAERIQGLAGNALIAIASFLVVPVAAFKAAQVLTPTVLVLKTCGEAFRVMEYIGFVFAMLGLGCIQFASLGMPNFAQEGAYRIFHGEWLPMNRARFPKPIAW